MGVAEVTLCDGTPCNVDEKRSNPYLDVSLSASSRGMAVQKGLQELNSFVKVSVIDEKPKIMQPFSMVLVCCGDTVCLSDQIKIDGECRKLGIPFVSCSVRGGREGFVFSDFGEAHCIRDALGERPAEGILVSMGSGLWECEEDRHGLYWGDKVTLWDEGGSEQDGQDVNVKGIKDMRVVQLDPVKGESVEKRMQFKVKIESSVQSYPPLSQFAADERLNKHFALKGSHYAVGLGCVMGALAAHEVLKRGGRYSPLSEMFWKEMDVEENVPETLLVVGAGAIGCELLKNLALLPKPPSLVHVVDPDSIEVSNLSRQLLFRESDVGKSKARVAGAKTEELSGGRCKVECKEVWLNSDTEASVGEEIYRVGAVLGAVDNQDARRYVDSRCCWHQVPYVDGGTQGHQGSVQMCLPHLTQPYSASEDPPVTVTPQCTLHMYPTSATHTLMLAKDVFHGLFTKDVASHAVSTWQDCLEWAQRLFEERFVVQIKELLKRHPPESLVKETGAMFWSPPRRCPRPLDDKSLYSEDEYNTFILLSAHLLAQARAITLPNSLPRKTWMDSPSTTETQIIFDKDTLSHAMWVHLFGSLRGRCYGIASVSLLEAKRIAGSIVPALVTTTAFVAGLQIMQLHQIAAKVWKQRNDVRFLSFFFSFHSA